MNETTREIAAQLEISNDEALKIQKVAECCVGIDWSEDSKKEITDALLEAKAMIAANENCGDCF